MLFERILLLLLHQSHSFMHKASFYIIKVIHLCYSEYLSLKYQANLSFIKLHQ